MFSCGALHLTFINGIIFYKSYGALRLYLTGAERRKIFKKQNNNTDQGAAHRKICRNKTTQTKVQRTVRFVENKITKQTKAQSAVRFVEKR